MGTNVSEEQGLCLQNIYWLLQMATLERCCL